MKKKIRNIAIGATAALAGLTAIGATMNYANHGSLVLADAAIVNYSETTPGKAEAAQVAADEAAAEEAAANMAAEKAADEARYAELEAESEARRAAQAEAAAEAPKLTPVAPEVEAPVATTPIEVEVENPMFDATGMDLQFAQDTVQAELGIWFSDSEDATGAGRMQIIDRNWTVVDQVPAPGTPVDIDTEIVFFVTK